MSIIESMIRACIPFVEAVSVIFFWGWVTTTVIAFVALMAIEIYDRWKGRVSWLGTGGRSWGR